MPSNTPNFALPYPSASDEPCDFAEQWCDFTAAIDGVFATFESGIARTAPTVPLAIVRMTIVQDVENGVAIPFDSVAADTAAMTDIDADPFNITITRRGRYSLSGAMELEGDNPNSDIALFINNDFASVTAQALDLGPAFPYRLNAYGPSIDLQPGDKVNMSFNTGTSADFTVYYAWLAVVWHADREVL